MKKLISAVSWAAFVAAISGSARAGIVYQSAPSLYDSRGSICSGCRPDWYYALDPMTLSSWTNVTGADVVISTYPGLGDVTFDVNVYRSDDIRTLVFSQYVTPTVLSTYTVGYEEYNVDHVDISDLGLAACRKYWISFYADSAVSVGYSPGYNNGAVVWNFGGESNNVPTMYNLGDNLDYVLYGYTSVPEPVTWALLILGVAMSGFAARRRNSGIARPA